MTILLVVFLGVPIALGLATSDFNWRVRILLAVATVLLPGFIYLTW